jgi:DNA-binding PadR family transcriptional regulator
MNDLLLLATLLDGPKHGYALKKEAAFFSGGGDMHNNLVYPLLRRYVGKGWVSQKKAAGERGQTRVVYSLTAAGRAELLRRLQDFGEVDARSADAFHLRVGLFSVLGKAAREQILEKRENYLEEREQRLAAIEKNMKLERFGGEVVRFLRQEISAERKWIEQLRKLSGLRKKHAERGNWKEAE